MYNNVQGDDRQEKPFKGYCGHHTNKRYIPTQRPTLPGSDNELVHIKVVRKISYTKDDRAGLLLLRLLSLLLLSKVSSCC